jgi:hypothetical protein
MPLSFRKRQSTGCEVDGEREMNDENCRDLRNVVGASAFPGPRWIGARLDLDHMTAPTFPPAPDLVMPRRALLSVSDKTGLLDAARALVEAGVELVSTGGTRAAIAAAGLAVRDVSELTGFPEMMDGRVKTLHPKVHGGLLGVRDAEHHAAAMREHDIPAIDILYCNLYPFEATAAAGASFDTTIENIDIGGPAMIRSSAKNHAYVAVCVDPEGMADVLAEVKASGGIRTWDDAVRYLDMGCTRIGVGDAAAILGGGPAKGDASY